MAAAEKDAIALLKADHRKVEDLFEQFEKSRSDDKKKKLAYQICMELIIHTIIEEEIFYPACRGKAEDDMLDEAQVEHDGAKMIIFDIEHSEPGSEYYDAKVSVLSEQIKHHVHEEEMRSEGLFAQARDAGLDLDDLGERMAARKQELMAQFKEEGLPHPEIRSLMAHPGNDAHPQGSHRAGAP
jgi:hypothetical protein